LLKITNLNTGYNGLQVLYDLSLHVEPGKVVSVIGPNGSGKSTLLKAISGILPVWKGDIVFDGVSIRRNPPSKNIGLGLTFCPQGNRVFTELTVYENLEIGGFGLPKQELGVRIDSVFSVFPALKERHKQKAGNLSGGEQQMLALARALIPSPKLLLLDEPSLGLAPNLLDDVFKRLVEINREFHLSVLIVEQKVMEVLSISDRVYSMKLGRIAFEGKTEELKGNKKKLKELFL